MKRKLFMLLPLTLCVVGSFPAHTMVYAASSAVDHGTNVTATIAAPSTDSTRVDITWNTMEFTYTDGGWNTATHSYDEGSWSADGGVITLQNNGIAEVNATFAYTPADGITGVTGAFENLTNDTLSLPAGENGSTRLSLSGKPARALSNTPIGTVTVTIQKLQNP